jgi:flavin-dependent dehydrogenase
VVCPRSHFDDLLRRRAEALGAHFEAGVRASGLIREGGRVVGVHLADGRSLRARFVLCADGAHSVFSADPRPRRSISTLMGWWDGARFEPGQIEMIFDRALAPLYGWLFPESATRVNIGICIDGQGARGEKTERNVREVFEAFLARHHAARLRDATPVGRWKGHPIVHAAWIDRCAVPGALYLGEAARITHPATGEGISQAMQSGVYAAETVAAVLGGAQDEASALRGYLWRQRRRFTLGQVAGHVLRGVVRTPLLDGVAAAFDQPFIRRGAVRLLGSALAGAPVREAAPTPPASRVAAAP